MGSCQCVCCDLFWPYLVWPLPWAFDLILSKTVEPPQHIQFNLSYHHFMLYGDKTVSKAVIWPYLVSWHSPLTSKFNQHNYVSKCTEWWNKFGEIPQAVCKVLCSQSFGMHMQAHGQLKTLCLQHHPNVGISDNSLTCTNSGMHFSARMLLRLCASLAKICKVPTVPSTISSIRTPSTSTGCPAEFVCHNETQSVDIIKYSEILLTHKIQQVTFVPQ